VQGAVGWQSSFRTFVTLTIVAPVFEATKESDVSGDIFIFFLSLNLNGSD